MKDASAGQMSSLLAGKHALVTGGSRGIGSAITRTLLSHGARVTVLGRNEKTLVDMARGLTQDCELDSVVADVGESDAVHRAFENARERFGRIDILVNNAGHASSAPFLKTDAELWRRMLTVNLEGAFHCTQSAVP